MKKIIILILCNLLLKSIYSQESLEIFYDSKFKITLKEFATFKRIWKTRELGNGQFVDIGIDGKKICEGTYKNYKKEGDFIFYYPNNQISSQGKYLNDRRIDKWIFFYNNGSVNYKINFSSDKFCVNESYDSIGNNLITNGNGKFIYEYCDSSQNIFNVSGTFKDCEMDDDWILSYKGNILAKEKYEVGKYKKGIRYDIDSKGIKIKLPLISSWIFEPIELQLIEKNYYSSLLYKEDYPFLSFIPQKPDSDNFKTISATGYGILNDQPIIDIEPPKYPGGEEAFKNLYLMNVLREAVRSYSNQGKFVVQFDVDCDGIPRNFKVIRAPSINMENTTISSFENIKRWIPGKYNGKPIKVSLTYTLKYKLVN